MRLIRYLVLPVIILAVAIIYLLLSHEYAGATMLVIFAGASFFFMWVLIPTFDHEGNTAPIDPDFEPPAD